MFIILLIIFKVNICSCVQWDKIRCSSDPDQNVPEGSVADIARFPWLGIVQHSFYLGGRVRFAITGGVLIHPAYAIAPAEDIAKILPEKLTNTTKFILWHSADIKYSLEVKDYVLHPEFEKVTYATIALLELITHGVTGVSASSSPVLPISMPVKGAGSFSDLYAVKMNDDNKELKKEVIKMNYVDNRDCEEFYYRAKLTYKKMAPVSPICVVSEHQKEPCVWDGGVALITRQSWGHWTLLGFGVRGPGCGAPARFLGVHDYLPWINDIISTLPLESVEDMHQLLVRRLSPVAFVMYQADRIIPKEHGQCDRKLRGHVLYKDSSELTVSKNFAQGFFFVVVTQIAQFQCATVNLEVSAKTNAAVWLEHHCHRDVTALMVGEDRPNYKKLDCFLYFKSKAFIEFRFYFSFKANIEVVLYGYEEIPRRIPDPFHTVWTTDAWWPTDKTIRWSSFVPYSTWWYSM